MKRTLLHLFLFLGFQLVSSCAAILIANVPRLQAGEEIDPTLLTSEPRYMVYTLLVSHILLFVLLYFTKLCRKKAFSTRYFPTPHALVLALLGFSCFIIGSSFLSQLFDLPDNGTTEIFYAVKGDVLCLLTLCIVGPIVEEIVFREGIMRSMLEAGWSNTASLTTSALLFALVHGNLAQIIPAYIMGIILGAFYLRNRNIWLCSLAHIFNNSLAIASFYYPEAESATQSWYSHQLIVGMVVALIAGLLILTLWEKVDDWDQARRLKKDGEIAENADNPSTSYPPHTQWRPIRNHKSTPSKQ